MKRESVLVAILAVVASLFLWIWIADSEQGSVPHSQLSSSYELQPFSYKTLTGVMHHSSEHEGKLRLITFWATWCPPCVKEVPHLQAIYSKYGETIEILAVSIDDKEGDVRAFVREKGIGYPVAMMNTRIKAAFPSVHSVPTSFLINQNGQVVFKHTGFMDEHDMAALIEKWKK